MLNSHLKILARLMGLLLGAVIYTQATAAGPETTDTGLVARGKYLTDLGGCASCHTAKGGAPFAGGLYMDTPYGPISTPNITPDKVTGIGAWSDDDFYAAIHNGISKNGDFIYPVMPFPWYTKATRDDVMAIKAYLFTLPAVRQVRPPNKLAFPFSVRESLLVWRAAFFNAGEFKADPQQSAEVNRGAYLVNGLAHCGECHNGRPVAGQSRYEKAFQGGVIDNWYAPNITSDVHDGVGGWTNDQLVTYLKTGMAPGKGIALGPMAETIQNLSHLKAADLQAIAAYLKATPATAEPHGKLSLFEGRDARGAQAYLNNCASCHGLEGKGLTQVVPALQGNGAVTAQGPQNVIQVVLGGLAAHGSYAPMLAVGAGMSDEEVADVTNFVRQIGGNVAPATATTGMVAELRGKTDTLMNGAPGTACPKIEEPALAKAVDASGIAAMLARMSDVTMLNVAHAVVSKLSKAAPAASQAALVNAITATYCPVLRQDTKLDANWKALKLGQFSALVYTEASSRDRPRQAALH